jgi:hypothetical protein
MIYPDTVESAKMVTMMLTKTSTMKYQKVRGYLENKTLEELQSLQAKEKPKTGKQVILSTNKNFRKSRHEDHRKSVNKTHGTDFDEDPNYQPIVEMESPKVKPTIENPQKRRIMTSGITQNREVGNIIESNNHSAKSKVIININLILFSCSRQSSS